MKILLILTLCVFLSSPLFSKPRETSPPIPYSIVRAQVSSDGNNISTWVWNTGVFNQDMRTNNTPGFEWPKGSGKFAIFSAGLSMGAYVNGGLRLASVSYLGEYVPGYVLNGVFATNSTFKLYKVSKGDNSFTNPDYANWGLMVPYGAPFDDSNGNGVYDPGVDKPGIKNAAQTIFVCLTDADPSSHTASEGFSGGTQPLFAEMHLSAWSYDNIPGMEDVQFLKMEVVNKNNAPWTKTHFGIIADPDLGFSGDDYIGCDAGRNLGYCYNATDMDGSGGVHDYGSHPPAVGIDLLKGGFNRSVTPNIDMYMTSFTSFSNGGSPLCESDPGTPANAYNFLRGLKKDSTPYINPIDMHSTKFCYSGDPETNTGWTEFTGKINNCGGDTTGAVISPVPPGDKRFIMGSGANNFTIVPGEKQTFVIAQLIAKGSNNKNSVTKLKLLDDVVQAFYNINLNVGVNTISTVVPEKFNLNQNYPNPFNPSTKINFDISKSGFTSLTIYDMTGKEVTKLVNQNLNAGSYEYDFNALNLPSGIYFYKLSSADFTSVKKMSLIK